MQRACLELFSCIPSKCATSVMRRRACRCMAQTSIDHVILNQFHVLGFEQWRNLPFTVKIAKASLLYCALPCDSFSRNFFFFLHEKSKVVNFP